MIAARRRGFVASVAVDVGNPLCSQSVLALTVFRPVFGGLAAGPNAPPMGGG